MIPAEHLQVDALNRLLERLWCERVEMRDRLYDAMRDLRLVRLTHAEVAGAEAGT